MEHIKITQEILPFHPRLGRNIRRDSRSLAFPVQVDGVPLVTTWWRRTVGPFDQGNLGSCTGNAGVGNLATEPFADTLAPNAPYPLTEDGALSLYCKATELDTFPGQYPPTDTGSDGLAVAAALKLAGMISGYVHAFDGPTARLALTKAPGIVGIKWYNSMFTPEADGHVPVLTSSGLAGGHEVSVDGLDVENQRVWFTNSWGTGWGVGRDEVPGRAWLSFADFDALMADGGDLVQFVPITQPAPVPTPAPTPVPPAPGADDAALWAAGEHFTRERHVLHEYQHLAAVLASWAAGKGFTS